MSLERPLILHMSVSLDGFVAHTDGVIDWLSNQGPCGVDHRAHRHRANLELLGQIGTIVMGRGAYQDMSKGWSGSDNPMAVLMNGVPEPQRLEPISSNAYADGCVTQVFKPA